MIINEAIAKLTNWKLCNLYINEAIAKLTNWKLCNLYTYESKSKNLYKIHIKVEVTMRRVVKKKLRKAKFYAAFRVFQTPIK